jgi:serine phosphatase RsbU (regulator of sigma subunit)
MTRSSLRRRIDPLRLACAVWLMSAGATSAAELPGAFRLEASSFAPQGRVELPGTWRYRPIASESFTRGEDWVPAAPGFPRFAEPPQWTGRGEFAIDLEFPPELVGRPLALVGRLTGAAQVEFAGRPIGAWGAFSPYEGLTNPAPLPLVAIAPGVHTLSITYANPHVARYRRAGWPAGFSFALVDAQTAINTDAERIRGRSAQMWGFTAFFLGFAALHFLLARFSDERRGNLDFAIVCSCAAGLVWLLLIKDLVHTPEWTWLTEPAMNVFGVGFALAGLWWVYGLFREARPRRLRAVALVGFAVAIWGVLQPRESVKAVFLFMLLVFFEMTREAIVGVSRHKTGARPLAVGVVALSVGFAIGLLTNMGYLPRSRWLNVVIPFSSMVALILCASFSLSRRLGEYARRAREMEEARALQLSMLPRELPRVHGYELAGAMDAATEVGGDYYDAVAAGDGSLVVSIGDATGHGAKAGTLVTAMKGVFGALSSSQSGAQALVTSNEAFLRMGLRPMAMALTWIRFDAVVDGEIAARGRIAVAGTPPPLLVRASGATESLELGAPPLGLLKLPRYVETDFELAPGDALVLFTDGFPEALAAGSDEQLGYERATALVDEAVRGEESVTRIVARLRRAAETWRGGGAPDDDVTFFVVRRSTT